LRGRVIGIYSSLRMSGGAVGALLLGLIAKHAGFRRPVAGE